jgi:ABC-type multidrug transport system fused ATPase/permease subunit
LAILSAVFIYTAAYYRASARELKRLQTSLDGVVFAQYSEALSGVTCIRAFQAQKRFVTRLVTALDDMNSAYFLTFANQRWLSIRMDAVGNLLVFVVGILVVTNQLNVDPSISGVILSYSLSLVQILQITVRYFSDVDNAMASTERLHEYTTQIPHEAALESSSPPPRPWPAHGAISFNNISLRYREGLPLVLHNFNLHIAAGEWIGIIGRTGAGKSSLLTALFRLVELSSGSITIDNIDISTLGLHDLRSHLAIIPQDPTLFAGTIRSNLDPFSHHTDLHLWDALRKCHLISTPTPNEKSPQTSLNLDSPVLASGANFSLGQRQLLTLARVFLLDPSVVLIDEGTSSLDISTDSMIQATMREIFAGKTVVSIAHRLGTVLGFDRICVVEEGRVREVGGVGELWRGGEGGFRALCEGSGIGEEDILRAEEERVRRRRGKREGD